MANILVIGGHGKVALLSEPLLVGRGHSVTAVVRNPDHEAEVQQTGATTAVADIARLDAPDLEAIIAGYDVVVWSAGAGGGSPEQTYAVDRDAAIRAIDAAVTTGVPRFVMVSYFGAGPDHGVDPDDPFFAYAEAKSAADAHLAGADLGWTILRPSGLTDDDATGRIEAGPEVSGASVSRGNVAQVIAAVVESPGAVGRTIEFNDGDRPITDVVGH